MTTEEVKQLQQRLKSEYDADSAAIERVLRLLKSNGSTNDAPPQISTDTIERKVTSAIAMVPANFTLGDIMGELSNAYPGEEINRASVSSVIYRLKEAHKVTIVKPGIGRRAAVYGKP